VACHPGLPYTAELVIAQCHCPPQKKATPGDACTWHFVWYLHSAVVGILSVLTGVCTLTSSDSCLQCVDAPTLNMLQGVDQLLELAGAVHLMSRGVQHRGSHLLCGGAFCSTSPCVGVCCRLGLQPEVAACVAAAQVGPD
jgi:hypothetical protein